VRSEAIVPLASVLDIVPLETLSTLALATSALLVAAALAGAVAVWMSAMRIHLPTSSRRPSGELSWNLDDDGTNPPSMHRQNTLTRVAANQNPASRIIVKGTQSNEREPVLDC
jgi:hypothetical protein